jgi:hypothetical protein
MDEHARQRREELIPAKRRSELDRQVSDLEKKLPELELRYLRDRITASLAKGRARSGPPGSG